MAHCEVANCNEAMLDIFPKHQIEFVAMERISVEGEIISASKVREMIRKDDWERVEKAVPDRTLNYLLSPTAKDVLDKIRGSISRH